MGYVGNQTTNSFSSQPSKQDFTGSSGSSITLSHAVSGPEAISLYINHVRQEPTTSYTVADTTVTFVGYTIATTDDVYVTYNALALQSVVPPDGSVSGAKLATGAAATNLGSSVNLSTIKDSTGNTTAMTIDSSGRLFTPARPAFNVYRNTGGAVSSGNTYIFETVDINIGGCYSTSTGKFTVPVAGVYVFHANILSTSDTAVKEYQILNGTDVLSVGYYHNGGSDTAGHNAMSAHVVTSLSANDEIRVKVTNGSLYGDSGNYNQFMGYLLG